jgi:hypothetical protein
MIIRFERTGGFTAIPLRVVIDTTALEPGEHQNLRGLLDATGFFKLPARVPTPAAGKDRFTYKLTVENTQGSHTVEVGDAGLPETLQPLIQHLETLARTQRKPSK